MQEVRQSRGDDVLVYLVGNKAETMIISSRANFVKYVAGSCRWTSRRVVL